MQYLCIFIPKRETQHFVHFMILLQKMVDLISRDALWECAPKQRVATKTSARVPLK